MERIELWRDIDNYPNYQVSNYGRVRSKDRLIAQFGHKNVYSRIMREKELKARTQNGGYLLVWLSKDGKVKPHTIHRLVASAFVRGGGNEVNHKDGNKTNNRADNLEWVTRAGNITHSYRQLGHAKPHCKTVKCNETGEVFPSIREAAKAKGINAISIGHNLAGRNKTAGGYTWTAE